MEEIMDIFNNNLKAKKFDQLNKREIENVSIYYIFKCYLMALDNSNIKTDSHANL